MPPLRIGLIYEDENIQILVEAIGPKIADEDIDFVSLKGGPWPGIRGDIPGLLQALRVRHIQQPLDKVFVVVDANSQGAERREELLRQKIGNRAYDFGTPHLFAITRQSETWLLGDPAAINLASGTHIPPFHDPESLQDAKRHLIQQLKNHHGREYSREFTRAATGALNLATLAQNCRGFQRFRTIFEDC